MREFRERLRDRLGLAQGPCADLPEVKPAIWSAFVHFWHQASDSIERDVETRLSARFAELQDLRNDLESREASIKADLDAEARRAAQAEGSRKELEAELRWKEEKIDDLSRSAQTLRSECDRCLERMQASEMDRARLEEAARMAESYRIEQERRFNEDIGRERERFDAEMASQAMLAASIGAEERRTFDLRSKELEALLENERSKLVVLEADRAMLASALTQAEARQQEITGELNRTLTNAAQGALASAEAIRLLSGMAEQVTILCARAQNPEPAAPPSRRASSRKRTTAAAKRP